MPASFSPGTREATLASLAGEAADVLVVGGGITGAGVARDAALRGLRVVLVERVDWAAGTSSRSSKLIHGGLRYLQQGDVGLVRESANERAVLRRIAPHLAVPVRMVMPTYGRTMHAKMSVALWTFARLATLAADEEHVMWDRDTALREEPSLDGTALYGAAVFTEYLTDDARLVVATVRGAHEAGARCANHADAVALRPDGAGMVAEVRDTLTDARFTLRTRCVVNAAGPWVDDVRGLAGALAGARLHLTKGVHLVVPHERLPVRNVVVMQAADRRSAFAVPRGGITYLGTTDTDHGPPADRPDVTAADADYLLDAARRTFTGVTLGRSDVVAAWAGLRPLLHETGKQPSEISRKDEIMTALDRPLLSVAGGKLTTHRRMAERVVDLVAARLGLRERSCRTDAVTLPDGELEPPELTVLAARLRAELPALPPGGGERLVGLYGAGALRILERAGRRPASAEAIPGLTGVLRAEIEHVLEEEMACTLEDVLDRRTRLLLFDRHQGLGGAAAVADIAAAHLGWDAARTAAELASYRRLAASLLEFP
jgi:glycerol-3-phosphate dehydrogenase